jgi:hypothetical protein
MEINMINWKNIEEVYPSEEDTERNYFYGYNPLLESFNYDIILKVDEYDYQGDSIVIFYNNENNKYGYLIFGWGSCSGCDSLQACNSYQEVEELRIDIHNRIIWFDTLELLREWINKHDYEGDYTDSDLVQRFKDEFKSI